MRASGEVILIAWVKVTGRSRRMQRVTMGVAS